MRREARDVLAKLDPTIDVTTPIKQLRVAQRQIVEIAKALLADARVIAMDEPTSSLTPREFEKLTTIIESAVGARRRGDLRLAQARRSLSRRLPRHDPARRQARVGRADLGTTSESELIRLMVGRAVEENHRENHTRPDVDAGGRRSQPWRCGVATSASELHAGRNPWASPASSARGAPNSCA